MRALSSCGDLIASGGEDGSVKVWHLGTIVAMEREMGDSVAEIRTRVPLPNSNDIPNDEGDK